MKIFLDTADLVEIRRAAEANLIDGVTTNPSLISQSAGDRDPKEIYLEIAMYQPDAIEAATTTTATAPRPITRVLFLIASLLFSVDSPAACSRAVAAWAEMG